MDISVREPKNELLYPELKRIGFDGIDLNFPTWDKLDVILSDKFENVMLEKYKKISDAGLKVCQTHLTYYPAHFPPLEDGSYRAYEKAVLPILIKEIDLVSKMNCRIAVIHLYFEESKENSRAANLQLIEKLLPVLDEKNVILAIENIYASDCGEANLTTAEDLLFYTEHFQSGNLGICLDTGHAVTRRQKPIEMVEKIGKTLKALHLHSNVFKEDLHLPPCFTANVDWRRFHDALDEVDYLGAFNMEISAPPQMNKKTALAYYDMIYGIAEGLIKRDTKSWTE